MPESIEPQQHKMSRYALNHIQIAFDLLDVLGKALEVEINQNIGYQVTIDSIAEYLEHAKEDIKQIQAEQPKPITIKQTDYEYLKYLIESLAADLPYNQTAKRALKTIRSIHE